MTKLAQAIVEGTVSENHPTVEFDVDKALLKKQKEDEIRMRLDEFAKELSQVSKLRGKE